jgi:hypothetical protein
LLIFIFYNNSSTFHLAHEGFGKYLYWISSSQK